jgi:hypothetical protein
MMDYIARFPIIAILFPKETADKRKSERFLWKAKEPQSNPFPEGDPPAGGP